MARWRRRHWTVGCTHGGRGGAPCHPGRTAFRKLGDVAKRRGSSLETRLSGPGPVSMIATSLRDTGQLSRVSNAISSGTVAPSWRVTHHSPITLSTGTKMAASAWWDEPLEACSIRLCLQTELARLPGRAGVTLVDCIAAKGLGAGFSNSFAGRRRRCRGDRNGRLLRADFAITGRVGWRGGHF